MFPPALLAKLDLATIAPIEGSFVDEELRASSADLLFSVGLLGGGTGLVYVLFEHQSTLDERMPLRLLRYKTRIWERYAAEHPDETRVPPIMPMLLHHGPKPWPWRPSFSSVVALDDETRMAFGRSLLDFEFALEDLARQSDAQIRSRTSDAIVRLTLLALRNGRSLPKLFELMAESMRALREELRGPAVLPALARLARYAFEIGDAPYAVVRSAFADALAPESGSEIMVSTADQLRAEDRREVLFEMLQAKYGSIDPALRARIEAASLEQLLAWARRIVVVRTIEELFAN